MRSQFIVNECVVRLFIADSCNSAVNVRSVKRCIVSITEFYFIDTTVLNNRNIILISSSKEVSAFIIGTNLILIALLHSPCSKVFGACVAISYALIIIL